MKSKNLIYKDIRDSFYNKSMIEIDEGSTMDLYTLATAGALESAYKEIENNRNPHIFTKLAGQDLDNTGVLINCPREVGEEDENYKYRLMNWTLSNEAGNSTSIEDSLLNLKFASSAEYIPFTEGVGTASICIIPKEYNDETIESALAEVQERVDAKASQSSYISYVIPQPKLVDIVAYVDTKEADFEELHSAVYQSLKESINEIPPNEYLDIGKVQKAILLNSNVNYFNVLEVYIDEEIQSLAAVYQPIDTKFLLGELRLINQ